MFIMPSIYQGELSAMFIMPSIYQGKLLVMFIMPSIYQEKLFVMFIMLYIYQGKLSAMIIMPFTYPDELSAVINISSIYISCQGYGAEPQGQTFGNDYYAIYIRRICPGNRPAFVMHSPLVCDRAK